METVTIPYLRRVKPSQKISKWILKIGLAHWNTIFHQSPKQCNPPNFPKLQVIAICMSRRPHLLFSEDINVSGSFQNIISFKTESMYNYMFVARRNEISWSPNPILIGHMGLTPHSFNSLDKIFFFRDKSYFLYVFF